MRASAQRRFQLSVRRLVSAGSLRAVLSVVPGLGLDRIRVGLAGYGGRLRLWRLEHPHRQRDEHQRTIYGNFGHHGARESSSATSSMATAACSPSIEHYLEDWHDPWRRAGYSDTRESRASPRSRGMVGAPVMISKPSTHRASLRIARSPHGRRSSAQQRSVSHAIQGDSGRNNARYPAVTRLAGTKIAAASTPRNNAPTSSWQRFNTDRSAQRGGAQGPSAMNGSQRNDSNRGMTDGSRSNSLQGPASRMNAGDRSTANDAARSTMNEGARNGSQNRGISDSWSRFSQSGAARPDRPIAAVCRDRPIAASRRAVNRSIAHRVTDRSAARNDNRRWMLAMPHPRTPAVIRSTAVAIRTPSRETPRPRTRAAMAAAATRRPRTRAATAAAVPIRPTHAATAAALRLRTRAATAAAVRIPRTHAAMAAAARIPRTRTVIPEAAADLRRAAQAPAVEAAAVATATATATAVAATAAAAADTHRSNKLAISQSGRCQGAALSLAEGRQPRQLNLIA